jgi:hypothetical protein
VKNQSEESRSTGETYPNKPGASAGLERMMNLRQRISDNLRERKTKSLTGQRAKMTTMYLFEI